MFFDEVSIVFEGGRGGNGMVNFHREKYVSTGPPDGGDGGNGGDVILITDSNFNTLHHFAGPKHFKAEHGKDGHKNNRAGATGEDLELKVPIGTRLFDEETGDLIADLEKKNQRFVVTQGGKGGFGNAHFVSSTRQAPKFAELGDRGETMNIRLELQLVADIGLVGFPSAGKSTFIAHVSAAKPKIADYPFTTLVPNLGVVNLSQFGGSKEQTFVIADIPGLIEGASKGKGLGHKFLKHVSRSAILLYLLDPFSYDDRSMAEQYKILHAELETFSPELINKPSIVVMNKIDAIPEEDREELKSEFLKVYPDLKSKFRMTSGVSGEFLDELIKELWNLVQTQKPKIKTPKETEETPVYIPIKMIDDHSYEVNQMYEVDAAEFESPINGQLISPESRAKRMIYGVSGRRIEQISRMTNVDQIDAIRRVYDILKKMGIQNALKSNGAKNGDYIKIDPHFFEFHDIS